MRSRTAVDVREWIYGLSEGRTERIELTLDAPVQIANGRQAKKLLPVGAQVILYGTLTREPSGEWRVQQRYALLATIFPMDADKLVLPVYVRADGGISTPGYY